MRIRIIAALLALLMLTPALFACGKNKEPAPWQTAEFESFNYNNVENAGYGDIKYAKDDTVFFLDYSYFGIVPFSSKVTKIQVFESNKIHTIINDSLGSTEVLVGDFAVVDSMAYYTTNLTYLDSDEDEDVLEITNFYSFDRVEKKREMLFTIESYELQSWMVFDEKIAYTTWEEPYYSEDEDWTYGLYVRDLAADKTIDICENAKSYSFAGGSLRYITYEEKTFYLWEYDFDSEKSIQIGTFDGAMGMDDHLYEEELSYNFTQDKIIITGESRDYKRFYIYDIETSALTEYNMPEEISSLVAGEDYAYAHCVNFDDTNDDYTDSSDIGIYKIDLNDGTYEKLSWEYDDLTSIYVSSDDEVYIEQSKLGRLGIENTIYKYDFENNKAVKLFAK